MHNKLKSVCCSDTFLIICHTVKANVSSQKSFKSVLEKEVLAISQAILCHLTQRSPGCHKTHFHDLDSSIPCFLQSSWDLIQMWLVSFHSWQFVFRNISILAEHLHLSEFGFLWAGIETFRPKPFNSFKETGLAETRKRRESQVWKEKWS